MSCLEAIWVGVYAIAIVAYAVAMAKLAYTEIRQRK